MRAHADHTLVDRDGVARNARALTLHQPWASLVAQGIKVTAPKSASRRAVSEADTPSSPR